MAKKNKLTGKFVVVFNTLVDGDQCFKDDNEKPYLYDSHADAYLEMFDDNLSMLEGKCKEDLEDDYEGVTPEIVKEMRAAYDSKDTKVMAEFLNKNPNCNDLGSWVAAADEFIEGRKAIFTGKGVQIIGKKL